ncbi:MAG: trehalose-phosphatase [Candidatus Omnitrophica bacterium CG12_big_fil_rev_8_21_14_0_65_42_8]|nr:MAG: trehalose-phosphatase [Candidatus Omnitrophica bacterium CG12_big_fil_rev_8_21_14_0_65_42_8]
MEHLFFQLNKLKDVLKNKFIFLFLDYDGTLTPIVQNPDKAVISRKTKEVIRSLSKIPHCRMAIISGRALKDIKNKIGLEGIIYAGNHGLEIEGPKIRFKAHVSIRYRATLRKIKSILKKKLSKIKGVIIEDKGLTLSVHYRLVDIKDVQPVKTIFHEAVAHYIISNKIKIRPGKKVLEIRPPLEWDKGKIVLWLLARLKFVLGKEPCLPIYIGDDMTDEDAFRALETMGLTVFVGGSKSSHARYYLKNTQEVTEFLGQILKIKTGERICRN